MGVRNYLIEGFSGSGKTTVAAELERRGHHVIHGDRGLAYYGEPATGEPLSGPPEGIADPLGWSYVRWIWPVEKVRLLAADRTHPVSFFCGGSRNHAQFVDLFDGVFILEADSETLLQRLARRPQDEWGGRPAERDFAARLHVTRQGMPDGGVAIDATQSVGEVVDEILRRCR